MLALRVEFGCKGKAVVKNVAIGDLLQEFVAKACCMLYWALAFGRLSRGRWFESSLCFHPSKRMLRGLSSLEKLVLGNCIHSNVRERPTKLTKKV
jgi:hypothetical protein